MKSPRFRIAASSSMLLCICLATSIALGTALFPVEVGLVSANPGIIINEIDYDQPGTDNAEFVELYNSDGTPVDLAAGGYQLVLISGVGGGATAYDRVDLTGTISGNGYYVVATNGSTITADQGGLGKTDGFAGSGGANGIQNGGTSGTSDPDAVALVTCSQCNGTDDTIVDTVSYEGSVPGYTEGTGISPAENNNSPNYSLQRAPNGTDSGNNSSDFVNDRAPTMGASNDPTAIGLRDFHALAMSAPMSAMHQFFRVFMLTIVWGLLVLGSYELKTRFER